ncbi:MAG: hypothetical protein FJ291_05300 [Planctomycetes bacterium]|nr:hypothetical protein [Planctomycetota bacterium]
MRRATRRLMVAATIALVGLGPGIVNATVVVRRDHRDKEQFQPEPNRFGHPFLDGYPQGYLDGYEPRLLRVFGCPGWGTTPGYGWFGCRWYSGIGHQGAPPTPPPEQNDFAAPAEKPPDKSGAEEGRKVQEALK